LPGLCPGSPFGRSGAASVIGTGSAQIGKRRCFFAKSIVV
jgi:hypothetical protein